MEPLVETLPPDGLIFMYLDEFQRRAQSCSFPHVPEECTKAEVQRFLADRHHNASVNPDMLALLFTTIAQGLQNGCYDVYGGEWVRGAMAMECEKGDVYSEYHRSHLYGMMLILISRCCDAMSETRRLYESSVPACHRNLGDDRAVPDQ